MSDTSTSPFGFDLVRRGYAREQVDDRISKLIADRDSARAEAEARAHVQTVFGQILRAQAQADAATEPTS